MPNNKFWETKSLSEMSNEEWESLCDGCGKCCMVQLQDEDTDELLQTKVACWLFEDNKCECRSYADRKELEPSCLIMDKKNVAASIEFAPETCAYKLLHEGKPLFSWHPLISQSKNSVHIAGVSMKNKTISMNAIGDDRIENYIIHSFSEMNKFKK